MWRGSQSEGGCGWNGLGMAARPGAEQRARPQDSLKTGDLWGASEHNVAAPFAASASHFSSYTFPRIKLQTSERFDNL